MILVTGANGAFGRLVVDHLLTRLPAAEIAVSVRDPGRSADLAGRGITVRRADFDDPAALARALDGADTVLINGTNYGTEPARRGRQHAAAIDAVRSAAAKRLVITSYQDLSHCPMPAVADFPGTEARAMAGGTAATILRLSSVLDAVVARDVRWAMASDALVAPAGRARITPAAPSDLAEATARVLREPGHEGMTYELSGPDAIGWDDLAALAAELSGRDLRYRPAADDEYRAFALGLGFPEQALGMLLDYYAALRAGWADAATGDLARLLGRPPTASIDAVRQALAR